MSNQSTRNRRGFTMIEMLIVMGLISIVVTMSMGRASRMIDGWRVDTAARAIQNDLQSAFALVGRNRQPLVVSIDTSEMQLRRMSRSGTDTFRLRAFGQSSTYKLAASNLQVYPATIPTTLEIYPPGLASDSLSVIITKGGASRRIRMLRGGLVQICKTGVNTTC